MADALLIYSLCTILGLILNVVTVVKYVIYVKQRGRFDKNRNVEFRLTIYAIVTFLVQSLSVVYLVIFSYLKQFISKISF